MFELAKTDHWYGPSRGLPELAYMGGMSALKAMGYAHVISHIRSHQPRRVLEFGHGKGSPLFSLYEEKLEMWGIDEHSGLGTEFSQAAEYEAFRAVHPRARFEHGLLGGPGHSLPPGHFDLVCSVSVVEHIPLPELRSVLADAHRLLRPGGLLVNSYDLCFGFDMGTFFAAHTENGFIWLDPNSSPRLNWDAANVAFEDPRVVMDYYLAYLPPEQRSWPGNFATCLTAARKAG
jgi:SAM-dependent methyltransferase